MRILWEFYDTEIKLALCTLYKQQSLSFETFTFRNPDVFFGLKFSQWPQRKLNWTGGEIYLMNWVSADWTDWEVICWNISIFHNSSPADPKRTEIRYETPFLTRKRNPLLSQFWLNSVLITRGEMWLKLNANWIWLVLFNEMAELTNLLPSYVT